MIGDILPLGLAAGLPLSRRGETAMSGSYDPELYKIRHSAAHIMAQAVRGYFADVGPVKFGVGPPIDDGFFYDMVLPRPLSVEELPAIENRMREIICAGSCLRISPSSWS